MKRKAQGKSLGAPVPKANLAQRDRQDALEEEKDIVHHQAVVVAVAVDLEPQN